MRRCDRHQEVLIKDLHLHVLYHRKVLVTINKFNEQSLCSNTGSVRDDPYWTSRKNSLELIELFSMNKVSLV